VNQDGGRYKKGKRTMHEEATNDLEKRNHIPKVQREAEETKQLYQNHSQTETKAKLTYYEMRVQ
jgi:hypothetical protein